MLALIGDAKAEKIQEEGSGFSSICVGITFRFSNAYQQRSLKYGSPHLEFFKHRTGYAPGEVKMDSAFR